MADLEAKLQQASGARVKLIATDGVRHMHHRGHDLSGVVIRARGFASPVLPGHVMQVIANKCIDKCAAPLADRLD